jgi:hypothetical protein
MYRQMRNNLPVERYPAFRRDDDSQYHPENRRFTGSVGAKQTDDFSGVYFEICSLDDLSSAVPFF